MTRRTLENMALVIGGATGGLWAGSRNPAPAATPWWHFVLIGVVGFVWIALWWTLCDWVHAKGLKWIERRYGGEP